MKPKLFVDVLEKVDKEFLEDSMFTDIKKKEFKKSGLYTLYDKKDRLYYVGKAKNLNSRLKHHLTNEHAGKWNKFSIYLTKTADVAEEVETIVLSLLSECGKKPKGNTTVLQVSRKYKNMQDRIKKILSDKKKTIDRFLKKEQSNSNKSSSRKRKSSNSKKQTPKEKISILKELIKKNKLLKLDWKGKTFHATLLYPSMKFEYQGKRYSSPSKATQIAKQTKSENGWTVWKIQDRFNQWVTLNEFIKK